MKMRNVLIFTAAMCLAACGSNGGIKFNPQDRTSTSMSIEERDAAIEAKRRSLLSVDIDSMIVSHNVKFSVLPPAVSEDVPETASDKLASRMIQIASQNGIGGLCTNPVLAMVSRVDCVDRSMTGTAPQKAIVKYNVTMYCGNMLTGDVYASAVQTVTGVGVSFEDAANKAFNELKNDSKFQQMLQTASERAMKWYDKAGNVKSFVDKAVNNKNYALASALLSSVPEQSTSFDYSVKKNEEVTELMFQENANEVLASMKNAMLEGSEEYNPQVGACFKLISPRSKVYAEAKRAYDEYVSKLDTATKNKHNREHELALQQMEIQKIKAPFEAQAAIEQMKLAASLEQDKVWSDCIKSSTASLAYGMRGGIFGENGMFGKGGVFGAGSFAEPLTKLFD